VVCDLGSLAKDATATITIVVRADKAGTITNSTHVSGELDDQRASNNDATASTIVSLRPTTLTYTGSLTEDFHDDATVSAHLVDTTTGVPLAGKTVEFKLNNSESCSASTNASGNATCTITPGEAAGTYPIKATFAADSTYGGSSDQRTFVVTREETTTTYTGPTGPIANGSTVNLSGVLKEDGLTGIAGRTLKLWIGTQSCTAPTNGSGSASCNVVVSQALGPTTVKAEFAGDTYYLPSSDTKSALIYQPTTGGGAFVIGDRSTTGTVTFWGSQWSTTNSLTGGAAPSSFKGFAKNPTSPSCGTTWTTDPGNSAPPPAGPLPAYVQVIVTSKATKSGSQISGDILHILIVRTNSGYDANQGHPGTGTVVATIC